VRNFTAWPAALCVAAAVAGNPASANPSIDANTPLGCKLGAALESYQKVDVANLSKRALPAQTVVNVVVYTAKPAPGESDDCFALDTPLAAGAHVGHIVKLLTQSGAKTCKAFVSSKYPAVFKDTDGSMTTQCDY